jgi:hypothetical protein
MAAVTAGPEKLCRVRSTVLFSVPPRKKIAGEADV